MNTDGNLLFGVLALQADLIDSQQFVEACTLWTTQKESCLADLLLERGWITSDDKAHVDYLVARKLQKHAGDVRASLEFVPDEVKRSLATIEDADILRTLAGSPEADHHLMVSVHHVPEQRDRYSLVRLHARGGLGQVWLARDGVLGRQVALKELRPEKAKNPVTQARFLKEARITGQLEHPGIIPVYELAQRGDKEHPFYTMRFMKGRTLKEAARAFHQKHQHEEVDAVELLKLLNAFVTVCQTVAYAHARGIVHRDLKGDNVALGDFGEVIVLDWGLAKFMNEQESEKDECEDQLVAGEHSTADLTIHGHALGTPAYMAPEQATGRLDLIGPHTDVYGLGSILYEILTGQPPFTGTSSPEVLHRVCFDEPAPPHSIFPEAPAGLEAICLRALAKRPEERFQSAGEMADQVQHWLAEAAKHQQDEEQRARFFALSPDLMSIVGFDGYFKQLNPAWEHVLGWTLTELLSKPYLDFIHPEDIEPTVAAAQRIVDGLQLVSVENRYRCRDGSYRWLHWTAQEIVGQQLIYCIARDVTERKAAETTLRDSEERHRSMFAALEQGLVLIDANGVICACNAAAERALGLTAGQMAGQTSLDPQGGAIREDGTPFPHEELPTVVARRTGRALSNVVEGVHRPDGSVVWLSVHAQPLFQADGVTLAGVLSTFTDITDRKRTEDALRATTLELSQLRERLQVTG